MTSPAEIAELVKALRSYIPCGRVLGHGENCVSEYLCETCKIRSRAAAALEEVGRDAQRYRWLKANHLQTGKDSWIRTGDDLEEAIDAAISAEGK